MKKGFPVDFSNIRDPHTVAAILKLFFRELPEPLFISDYYDDFVKYCAGFPLFKGIIILEDIPKLKELIAMLPASYRATLGHLLRFLRKVSENSRKNLMEIPALATCFSPNVLRAKQELTSNISDASAAAHLLVTMIENVNEFNFSVEEITFFANFDKNEHEQPTKASQFLPLPPPSLAIPPIQSQQQQARAKYNYNATGVKDSKGQCDMSFHKDDIMVIIDWKEGWTVAQLNGITGLVPCKQLIKNVS